MIFKRVKNLVVGDQMQLFSGKQVLIISINKGYCNKTLMLDFQPIQKDEIINPPWCNINKDAIVQILEKLGGA